MKTFRMMAIAGCMAVVASGCSSDEPKAESGEFVPAGKGYNYVAPLASRSTLGLDAAAVQGFNEWAFSFNKLMASSSQSDYYIFSPVGLSACLSMIADSYDAESAAKVVKSAGMTDTEELRNVSTSLMSYLTDQSHKAQLFFANAVWYDTPLTLNGGYRDRMARTYGATVSQIDFASDLSTETVNGWISDNTRGLIKDIEKILIKGNDIKFANTIYFESTWAEPFKPEMTAPGKFYGSRTVSETEMMHGLMHAGYYADDVMHMVGLPYTGDYTLFVIRPVGENKIDDIAGAMTYSRFGEIIGSLTQCEAELTVPKLTFESAINVYTPLLSLGYPTDKDVVALSADASDKEVFLGSDARIVRQNVWFSLDEEGTKAAALTHTGDFLSTSPEKVEFKVDGPFMLVLINNKHRIPLFMGCIHNLE